MSLTHNEYIRELVRKYGEQTTEALLRQAAARPVYGMASGYARGVDKARLAAFESGEWQEL